MWRKGILFIILMIALLQGVSAQIVAGESERIDMQNCGFVVDGEFNCGQTAVLSCDVVDYTSSPQGIVDGGVKFSVENEVYVAQLNTGTRQNGSWAATIPITTATPVLSEVTSVYAVNSIGVECQGTANKDTDYCAIQWNSNDRFITVDCTCSWATTEVCYADDTSIVTSTPGAGCVGETAYETTSYCDYCDPGWVASYSDCIPDRPEVDPFYGTAVKSYTETDYTCCLATGLTSDCAQPADAGSDTVCQLDAWTGDGKNTFNTKTNQLQNTLDENKVVLKQSFTTEKLDALIGRGQNERAVKPVVFDFDNDGETELVYFKNNGFIMYDAQFNQESLFSTIGVQWNGQPGMFGFNELYSSTGASWIWSGGNYKNGQCSWASGIPPVPNACDNGCDAIVDEYEAQQCCNDNPSCLWVPSAPDTRVGFAGIIQDSSGDDHFVVYAYITGSWSKIQDINLWSTETTAAPGAGVSCWTDYCYFRDQNMYLWRVNVDTGAYTRQDIIDDGGSHIQTDAMDVVPTFVQTSSDGTIEAVVVEGVDVVGTLSQQGTGISICNIDATDCNFVLKVNNPHVNTNVSISRMAAGPFDADIDGTPVYYNMRVTIGDTDYLYAERMVVDDDTLLQDSVNSGREQLTGTGGDAGCITDPALGRCDATGEYRVVNQPHFVKETSTTVTLPDAPWQWTEDTEITTPLIQAGGFVGETKMARSTCSGDLCLLMSGTPTAAPTNYSDVLLFYNNNNGAFTSVVQPAGFLNPGMMIRYAGGMNGKIYLITGVASGDTYINFDLWSLDGEGTLTKIADLTGGAIAAGNTAYFYGEPMLCSPERCWVPITRGESGDAVHIFEILADETWEVHRPSSIVSLGPYTLGTDAGAPSTVTANPEGVTEIYGYAKTSTARYYAVGAPLPRGNAGSLWPGYLLRVPIASPASFSILDSSSGDSKTYMGLHADPNKADEVWWGMIPDSTSCTLNTTKYSAPAPIVRTVEAGIGTGDDRIYSNGTLNGVLGYRDNCFSVTYYDTRNQVRQCEWELYSASSGNVDLESRQTVDLKAGTIPPCGGGTTKQAMVGPVRSFGSTGGLDEDGKNYVSFYYGFNALSGDGDSSSTSTQSFSTRTPVWKVVMMDGHLFFPETVQYGSITGLQYGRVWNYGANPSRATDPVCNTGLDEECISGSCCIPLFYVSGIYPFSSGQTYMSRAFAPALFNSDYQFGNSIRGTHNSELKVDQLTSGGVATIGGDYTYYSCSKDTFGTSGNYNPFVELTHTIIPETICPSSVVTVDTDSDAIDEVWATSGLLKWGAGRIYNPELAQTSYAAPFSVDMNADTYVDLGLISTRLVHIISSPLVSTARALDGAGTSMESCYASFSTTSGKVSAIPIGVAAENPSWLVYSAELVSESGSIADQETSSRPEIFLTPIVGGSYDVNFFVEDQLKYAQCGSNTTCQDEAVAAYTCLVNVPADILIPDELDSCSIGVDGEFNFPDILQTDWLLGTNSDVPTMVASQFVRMDSSVQMIHEAPCTDEGFGVEVRLRGDTTSDSSVTIDATSTVNGIAYQIGGLRLYQSTIQVYTVDGSQTVYEIDPTDIGEWIVVYLSLDFTNQEYTVSVDGVDYATVPFANEANGEVTGLHVYNDVSTTDIDYIRTEGLTGIDRDTRSEDDKSQSYANQALDACIYAPDRDFDEYPPGSLPYPAMTRYCERLNEGPCKELDLVSAVHYNTECYWEAMNYCQVILFSETGGFDETSDVRTRGGASLSGTTPCATLLSTGAAWTTLAEPSVKQGWNIIKRNMTTFLVLLFLLALIVPVVLIVKRRK